MLVVQNDFAKQPMDRIWDEYKTKHGKTYTANQKKEY